MKCYTQVYVMGSIEAVETYCKAFGARVTYEIKNETETAYEHCELSVNGEPVLGVVVEEIHELPWNKYCATVIDKYGVCWWIAV